MGLFTVKPKSVAEVVEEVVFPKVDLYSAKVTSERSRVLNMPGVKALVDATVAKTDSPVKVFEVNRNIKGSAARVLERRPGLVAELPSESRDEVVIEASIPVQHGIFDQTSIRKTTIRMGTEAANEFGTRDDLYAHAAATAIFQYVEGQTEQDLNRGVK
jgi:hypothetical protein